VKVGSTVTFTLIISETGNATLTVNHNAAGSPVTYTLRCTGLLFYYFPIASRNAP